MRFPSFQNIIEGTARVIRQYPLEVIAATTGTIAFLQLAGHMGANAGYPLTQLLLTSLLALPSFLAITLRGRYRDFSLRRTAIEYGLVAVVLAIFFSMLDRDVAEKEMLRFAMLFVAAHLLVACAGFMGRGSVGAFWQFNKDLFLRMITALIFSAVFFAGLSGALASLDALFAFKIDSQRYVQLGIFIFGMFNTFYFLAGVPTDEDELEQQKDFPTVLKVFTQYVLVPLVIVYLCILLAYEVKIVAQWSLPKGWVSNLIIGYGIAGILSILLVHPIKSEAGNNWIKFFAKWFYILLLPLVLLMLVAIGTRVLQYGFTIERVIVLALAIWLLGMALFYLWKPRADIRVIPFSLAMVALLVSAVGFGIAKRSQINELTHLLEKNKLLSQGKLQPATSNAAVPSQDRARVESILYYLLLYHGVHSVSPLFSIAAIEKDKGNTYYNALRLMKDQLNLSSDGTYGLAESKSATWCSFTNEEPISVKGVDEVLLFNSNDDFQISSLHMRSLGAGKMALCDGSQKLSPEIEPQQLLKQLVDKHGLGFNGMVGARELLQKVEWADAYLTVAYKEIAAGIADSSFNDMRYEGIVLIDWKAR